MTAPSELCVFCKIVAGAIPSSKVFEDERCLAFLDIGPLAPGHVLVFPKTHADRLWEVAPETASAIGAQLPRLARAVMEATGAAGCNILQNNGEVSGQVVEHVHFHIIPRRAADGLPYSWPAGSYGEGEMASMQRKIQDALQ